VRHRIRVRLLCGTPVLLQLRSVFLHGLLERYVPPEISGRTKHRRPCYLGAGIPLPLPISHGGIFLPIGAVPVALAAAALSFCIITLGVFDFILTLL
jgi:hypothetical protein